MRDGYALVPVLAGDPEPEPEARERTRGIWDPNASFVEPASRLTGRLLDQRYELGAAVGTGGMAYVYRATDTRRALSVAVKVLASRLAADQESVARLQREAELAMRLDHPNVCHILATGNDRGLHYLVMPLLHGELLSTRAARDGKLPLPEVLRILRQLCAGLQHAHERGVLHRDLKPENVMLVSDESGDRAVVMDFGLAKPVAPEGELKKLTDTGVVLGTPEFMSPEQIRGATIDHRSDQYALGVLAFELLTGELPFKSGTAQETMMHRLTDTALRLSERWPDAPAALDAALARVLDRDPTCRFPDLHALAAALDAVGA
jgi:serine/threonine-protein kinase